MMLVGHYEEDSSFLNSTVYPLEDEIFADMSHYFYIDLGASPESTAGRDASTEWGSHEIPEFIPQNFHQDQYVSFLS